MANINITIINMLQVKYCMKLFNKSLVIKKYINKTAIYFFKLL